MQEDLFCYIQNTLIDKPVLLFLKNGIKLSGHISRVITPSDEAPWGILFADQKADPNPQLILGDAIATVLPGSAAS